MPQCGYCNPRMIMQCERSAARYGSAILPTGTLRDHRASQSLPAAAPICPACAACCRASMRRNQPGVGSHKILPHYRPVASLRQHLSRCGALARGGALIVSFIAPRAGPCPGAGKPEPWSHRAKPPPVPEAFQGKKSPLLDSWIRIDADGHITGSPAAELGNGIKDLRCLQIAASISTSTSRAQPITVRHLRDPTRATTAGAIHAGQLTAILHATAQAREDPHQSLVRPASGVPART